MMFQIHGEVTGGKLFNLYQDNAKVRLITLPDINKFLDRDRLSTAGVKEDATGVIHLGKLVLKVGSVSYSYGSTPPSCWVGSPSGSANTTKGLVWLLQGGTLWVNHANNYGIRPVVCINANVQLVDNNGDGVLEIVF